MVMPKALAALAGQALKKILIWDWAANSRKEEVETEDFSAVTVERG